MLKRLIFPILLLFVLCGNAGAVLLDPVKNFAKGIVSTVYDASATSIVLESGDGANFPSSFSYNVIWWNATDYPDPSDDPNREIVRVTGRSTDTLTVTRAQESTSATTKNTSGKTYLMVLGITKKVIDDIDAHDHSSGAGTTVPIAGGGSGQATQQAAIDALTDVASATNEYVLTKDTVSGEAIWKVRDVTAASSLGDNRLLRGDGGSKGVQDSGITINDTDDVSGANTYSAVEFIESGGSGASTTVVPYIQLSDSTNQEPSVTTPIQVEFDTLDGQQTFAYTGGDNEIVVPETGIYFIVAAAQVGETTNANINIDCWIRNNDVDVDNSNVRNFVTEAADTKVVVSQNAISLTVGDVIKIYMSIDLTGKGAGFKVINPAGEPRIPSIIFTMYKMGN